MISFRLYTRLPLLSTMCVHRFYVNTQNNLVNGGAWRQFAVYKASLYDKQNICASFFQTYRYMAGHAKWQNVKGIKQEKDKEKSKLCNRYVRLVSQAVRAGGPDPKGNSRLARILEEARKDSVPLSTLESAMKRANTKKVQFGTIEIEGPGGFFLVLDYETDNLCEFRRNVKVICRKYSAGIYPGTGGRWRSSYEQKGIVRVTSQLNGEAFDSEKMLDAAIEAGAEDVQKVEEDDKIVFEFYCAPDDLTSVKADLEKNFVIEEFYVGYLPICLVSLSDQDKTTAMNFLDEIGDLPDVSRMFENIQ